MLNEVILRDADVEECRKGGLSPQEAVAFSINRSTKAWLLPGPDGDIVAYWGWRDDCVGCSSAQVWMLSTPAIERHRLWAARKSRAILNVLLETHYLLWAVVDPEYDLAIRWLKWLGFGLDSRGDPFDCYILTRGSRA